MEALYQALAEAQLLERALKEAILKDVAEYGAEADQAPFLDTLKVASLGQLEAIATGKGKRDYQKLISACVGFFDLVKMYWNSLGRTEISLKDELSVAVKTRNRLAHSFIAEIVSEPLKESDALVFLSEASRCFSELRQTVACADFMSSKLGGIAEDGSSKTRFKVTKKTTA